MFNSLAVVGVFASRCIGQWQPARINCTQNEIFDTHIDRTERHLLDCILKVHDTKFGEIFNLLGCEVVA